MVESCNPDLGCPRHSARPRFAAIEHSFAIYVEGWLGGVDTFDSWSCRNTSLIQQSPLAPCTPASGHWIGLCLCDWSSRGHVLEWCRIGASKIVSAIVQ